MAVAGGTSGEELFEAVPRAWSRSGFKLLLLAIFALIVGRFVLAATSDLSEDEAYYWLWSLHFAGGYYDHPPMIAYWIGAGTAIFGQTAFGVRFMGLLSVLAGSYAFYLTSLSLFRQRGSALLCVIWLNATLLLNAASIVATPDTPLAFFLAITLLSLAKLIETQRGLWWLAIGLSLGLAFMSKYTAALFLPGLFIWMVASSSGRKWFVRPQPYAGALLALIAVLPVLYWNYAHGWVSFAKQAAHSVKDKPANAFASIGEFIGGQAGLASPLIFCFCLFGSFYALFRGIRKRDSRFVLLGALAAPVFAFFVIHAGAQKIQPNWPGFIYPVAILAAVHGFLAYRRENHAPRWAQACFRAAPWVGIAISLVAFLQLGTGVLPIDSKKDPTSRLKGWAKLGRDIAGLREALGAGSILTDRYAITGELAFYAGQPVWQTGERIRYANLPVPDEDRLKDGGSLLVLRQGAGPSKAAAFFEASRLVTTLVRQGGVRPRDAYDVYLLTGYRGEDGGLFCGDQLKQGLACN